MKQGWIYEKEYKGKWYKLDLPIFKEWIFFNYSYKNINGIITIGSNGLVPGIVLIRTFENGIKTCLENYSFKENEVKRSITDNSISMQNKNNEIYIIQESKDKFRTYGNIKDISWNLKYKRESPVFEGFEQKVGWFKILGENIGWQALMPKAEVNGDVNLGNKQYNIQNGSGYVDSNWGTWLIVDAHWNWVQGYGLNCTVSMFDMRYEEKTGILYLFHNNTIYEFYKHNREYTVSHPPDCWVKDEPTGLTRPTKTIITAENEKTSLILTLEERWKNTFIEKLKIPFINPYWIMFESFNIITGKLHDKNTNNEYDLDMYGFKEYGLISMKSGGNLE